MNSVALVGNVVYSIFLEVLFSFFYLFLELVMKEKEHTEYRVPNKFWSVGMILVDVSYSFHKYLSL